MTIEVLQQLVLLQSEPFPGGPARPPSVRRSRKPAGGTTLPLFSPAPEPLTPLPVQLAEEAPPEDPRLAAINRVIAETVARHRHARTEAADPADPHSDPIPPDEVVVAKAPELAPFDVRTFQFVAQPRPAERAALVSLLAERLSGHVKRGGRFHAEADEDHIDGHVDGRTLSIAFSGAMARTRWLSVVQEVARERGLAEPE
jgi:hypothetical protein